MSDLTSIEYGGQTIRRDSGYAKGACTLLLVDMQRIWAEPMMDPTHPMPSDSYFMKRVHETVIPSTGTTRASQPCASQRRRSAQPWAG